MWRIEVYRGQDYRLFYLHYEDYKFSLTTDEDEATLVHRDHVGFAIIKIMDKYDDITGIETSVVQDEQEK